MLKEEVELGRRAEHVDGRLPFLIAWLSPEVLLEEASLESLE